MKFLFLGLVLSSSVYAFDLGRVTISGQGCESKTKPVETESIDIHSKKIHVPLQILADKKTSKLIERTACNVRIPIKAKKDESLIIQNIQQDAGTNLDSKAKAILNLDVSAVGINPEIKLFVESKQTETVRMSSSNKNILTDCGQEIILALNSSVRIEGSGLGKVLSKAATLDIVSQKCK